MDAKMEDFFGRRGDKGPRGGGNQSIDEMDVSHGEEKCFPNKVRIIGSLRVSLASSSSSVLPQNRRGFCAGQIVKHRLVINFSRPVHLLHSSVFFDSQRNILGEGREVVLHKPRRNKFSEGRHFATNVQNGRNPSVNWLRGR